VTGRKGSRGWFADPEAAALGLTTKQAEQPRVSTASAEIDLAEAIGRPWTYEEEPRRPGS